MEVIQLHQPVSDDEAKKIAVNRLKNWSSESRKRNGSLFVGTEWRASATRNDRYGPYL